MEEQRVRVHLIDELRGLLIIIIVLYHLLYDIDVFFPSNRPWTAIPLVEAIRLTAACSFIVIAGISCHFTRSNIRRGIKTLLWALLITLTTAVLVPEQMIWFGILHLLGSCMVLYGATFSVLKKIKPMIGLVISLLLFLFTYRIFHGVVGWVPLFEIHLPQGLYTKDFLFPLGFAKEGFFSSDYYPLLPWMFLFGVGFFLGPFFTCSKLPRFFCIKHVKNLGVLGKKTLMIYLLHQPILYTTLWLISKV